MEGLPLEFVPSAPPLTPPLSPEIRRLENQIYTFDLALTTFEIVNLNDQLEKIKNDSIKMDIIKCDEQCKEANQSNESNSVDDILKKINDIFNK